MFQAATLRADFDASGIGPIIIATILKSYFGFIQAMSVKYLEVTFSHIVVGTKDVYDANV